MGVRSELRMRKLRGFGEVDLDAEKNSITVEGYC
jgi:hypothetical protein